jgi:hypothetical protein
MGWLNWLAGPTEAEIRAEVWSLGVRHHGEPLDGALKELGERRLAPARVALLRMCVQHLQRQ